MVRPFVTMNKPSSPYTARDSAATNAKRLAISFASISIYRMDYFYYLPYSMPRFIIVLVSYFANTNNKIWPQRFNEMVRNGKLFKPNANFDSASKIRKGL